MADRSTGADVLHQLDTLFRVGVVGDLSDGQLVQRFVNARDGAKQVALAALVGRHGPMVLRVCRQVLGDSHDAQDAFQATFLVLAHKAGSVRKAESVASWLYGVAHRVAVRAQADTARRREHERRAAITAVESPVEAGRAESFAELHEEIARLPERYRQPVVLCYLEGLTTEAAAQRLGWPRGTVLSRLSRARERLRGRLTRRGLAPSAGPLGAWMSPGAATPSVPAVLHDATVREALMFVGRRVTEATQAPTGPISLALGVLHAMTISKLKFLGSAALAVACVLGGFRVYAFQGPDDQPAVTKAEPAQSSAARAKPGVAWEYKVEFGPDRQANEELLNSQGQEGWELVAASDDPRNLVRYIFKRPKQR